MSDFKNASPDHAATQATISLKNLDASTYPLQGGTQIALRRLFEDEDSIEWRHFRGGDNVVRGAVLLDTRKIILVQQQNISLTNSFITSDQYTPRNGHSCEMGWPRRLSSICSMGNVHSSNVTGTVVSI